MFTTPERAARFLFATPAERIVRCEIDARAGGTFTVVDRRNGEDVAHVGTYLELDRPRRIVFTFRVGSNFIRAGLVRLKAGPHVVRQYTLRTRGGACT